METKKRTIDEEVSHTLEKLATLEPDSKEYKLAAENLKVLCEARGQEKPNWLSRYQGLFVLGGSLLEILLMMNHERLHVISTKALNQLWKTRV